MMCSVRSAFSALQAGGRAAAAAATVGARSGISSRWMGGRTLSTDTHSSAGSKTFNIILLGGDGVGPEVAAESVKILRTLEQCGSEARFDITEYDIGGIAIDKYSNPLPDDTLEVRYLHMHVCVCTHLRVSVVGRCGTTSAVCTHVQMRWFRARVARRERRLEREL